MQSNIFLVYGTAKPRDVAGGGGIFLIVLDIIPEKSGYDDWNNKNVNTPYEHFWQIPVNTKVYIKNLQIQICKSNKKKNFNWSQEMHRLIQTKNHWQVS